jgi:4-hydroxybenzoate polyprenyltransferase
MVLNDCFDVEEDRRFRPGRPLPSGTVALRSAWLSGWMLLACGVLLAAVVGTTQLGIAVILALCIILYDGMLKHSWVGGLVMAACRYLNWLMALSVAGLSLTNLLLPLPVFLYIAALTYLSSAETTAHSKVPLAVSAAGMVLAAAAISILNQTGILPHTWALLLLGVALPMVLLRLLATAHDFTPGLIQQTMKFLILGIIPLDAILVFAGGPWWGGLIILTLLIPGRALARILYVT